MRALGTQRLVTWAIVVAVVFVGGLALRMSLLAREADREPATKPTTASPPAQTTRPHRVRDRSAGNAASEHVAETDDVASEVPRPYAVDPPGVTSEPGTNQHPVGSLAWYREEVRILYETHDAAGRFQARYAPVLTRPLGVVHGEPRWLPGGDGLADEPAVLENPTEALVRVSARNRRARHALSTGDFQALGLRLGARLEVSLGNQVGGPGMDPYMALVMVGQPYDPAGAPEEEKQFVTELIARRLRFLRRMFVAVESAADRGLGTRHDTCTAVLARGGDLFVLDAGADDELDRSVAELGALHRGLVARLRALAR